MTASSRVARKARPARIRAGTTGGQAFTQVVHHGLAQVTGNAGLWRGLGSAEALHQLRVGLRRLRAALRTFRLLLVGQDLRGLKTEIRWIGKELDPARDLDVFVAEIFPSMLQGGGGDPLLRAFGARLQQARTARYARALEAVASSRFTALLGDCADLADRGQWTRSRDVQIVRWRDGKAAVLAAAALSRLSHQLGRKGRHLATLDPAARHRVRIRAKTLRYAAEFFAETFGHYARKRHSTFVASLAALQDVLGELNDRVVAQRTARVVAGRSAAMAFCVGRLIGAQEHDETPLADQAVRAFECWRRVKPFWP